jgi:hypothetical protein
MAEGKWPGGYNFYDKSTFIRELVPRIHTGWERLDQVYNGQCFPIATRFSSTTTINTSLNIKVS